MAFTISPVLNPCVGCCSLGAVRGKPYLFIKHICLEPCPYAVIDSGTTPAVLMHSGVLLPTHAASNQWVFGSSLVLRLYLVSPPEPHSIGKPKTCKRLNSSQRVVLTAAASFSGAFACARIFFRRSGFFLRKIWMSWVPLAMLHFSHAKHKLLMR